MEKSEEAKNIKKSKTFFEKIKLILKNHYRILITFICVLILLEILEDVFEESIMKKDVIRI